MLMPMAMPRLLSPPVSAGAMTGAAEGPPGRVPATSSLAMDVRPGTAGRTGVGEFPVGGRGVGAIGGCWGTWGAATGGACSTGGAVWAGGSKGPSTGGLAGAATGGAATGGATGGWATGGAAGGAATGGAATGG
jgi:hypothetical protein